MDEVEHDIMNYQNRQITQTSVLIIHDIMLNLIQSLGFTHVTNGLATVTIRHLGVPQA